MIFATKLRWIETIAAWLVLFLGGISILRVPARAPACIISGLLWVVLPPLVWAWRSARGTGLRGAVGWAGLALILMIAGQWVGSWEPVSGGRPWAGHWTYLGNLAMLAALIAVLNARRPGGGAWALLMALMVLVLLLPWLEGSGLARRADPWDRLRLDPPWNIFFGVLAVTGVTNYLPTRYGLAALGVAAAIGLEYLGLTRTDWPNELRGLMWSAGPWTLALAIRANGELTRGRRPEPPGLERLWAWFRDHWGVVWALRVMERWNRMAAARGWPIRLAWHGVERLGAGDPIPSEAEATLRALLARFATADRLVAAAGSGPCEGPGQSGS